MWRRLTSIFSAIAVVAGLAAIGTWAYAHQAAPARTIELAPVAVPAGLSTAVCPGALAVPSEEGIQSQDNLVYDPAFDPRPTSVVSSVRGIARGGEGGTVGVLGSSGRELAPPLGVTSEGAGDEPLVVSAASSPDVPALAAGGTVIHSADGDLRGLAGSSCVPATSQAWIVAGSTEVGSSGRLILVNPGLTTVNVDIDLWDGAGRVDAVGTAGLVVPPSSQRVVLLEGLIADARRLAVHVTASGGEIAAFIQHSRLDRLTPAGVDYATTSAAPATETIVPGVSVTASAFDSASASVLRILNPGDDGATLTVTLWGPDGPVALPGFDAAQVPAHVVADLSLAGLPTGDYVAQVTSSVPVVVAAQSLRLGSDGVAEFAWSPSGTLEQGYLALPPPGLGARLVVGAETDASVTVRPVNASGNRVTLGDEVILRPTAGQSVTAEMSAFGATERTVALAFSTDGNVGVALVVTASDAAGEMITVLAPAGAQASPASVRAYPGY
jgi:hypothetical protein